MVIDALTQTNINSISQSPGKINFPLKNESSDRNLLRYRCRQGRISVAFCIGVGRRQHGVYTISVVTPPMKLVWLAKGRKVSKCRKSYGPAEIGAHRLGGLVAPPSEPLILEYTAFVGDAALLSLVPSAMHSLLYMLFHGRQAVIDEDIVWWN